MLGRLRFATEGILKEATVRWRGGFLKRLEMGVLGRESLETPLAAAALVTEL